jgi:hypothetical protein
MNGFGDDYLSPKFASFETTKIYLFFEAEINGNYALMQENNRIVQYECRPN